MRRDLLVQVGQQVRQKDRGCLGEHQHLRVDHVQQQGHHPADDTQPVAEERQHALVATAGRVQQKPQVGLFDPPFPKRPLCQDPFRDGGLHTAGPPAGAAHRTVRQRQVGDVPGAGVRAPVHLAAGGDRRVDDVPDEQVHQAAPGPRIPEHDLCLRQRAGMAVHMDRQAGRLGEHLTDRHVTPPEQTVLDDDAALRVHPSAGDHSQSEQPAASGVPRHEAGKILADLPQHLARVTLVRHALLGHHLATQVHQTEGDVGDGDVHPAGEVTLRVDVQGDERAAGAWRAGQRRQFTQQPEGDQIGGLPRHHGRAQPGRAADEGARHRPVIQHGAQHRRGGACRVRATRGHGRRQGMVECRHG